MRGALISLSFALLITDVSASAGAAVAEARVLDCRIVEQAARDQQLSVAVLTRLLWTESRFQADAISPAGAQGVAQFVPTTATERGLLDPYDPVEAIGQAARLIADLGRQFGNIGLAIAAYNAGPNRVTRWLNNTGNLPHETRAFVVAVTGYTPEDWQVSGRNAGNQLPTETQSCLELIDHPDGHGLNNIPAGLGRSLVVTQSGHFISGQPRSGHLMPGMEQIGRLMPGVAQSGRLMSGVEQIGRLTPGLTQNSPPR
jgi:hypothetical protein